MATDEERNKFQQELLDNKVNRPDWCICNLVKKLICILKGKPKDK